MGRFDSSLTRVQPVFRELLGHDATGTSWLPKLLDLAGGQSPLARRLAQNTGHLLQQPIDDYFENRIAPPLDFLQWLINNPDKITAPKKFNCGPLAKAKREDLLGRNGIVAQEAARTEALVELSKLAAARNSRFKWWAFEGFTAVDCLLETDELVMFIEGKRTDVLSPATLWYAQRNQLARNLEAARQMAAGRKEYAVLLVTESPMPRITLRDLEPGWPHLSTQERGDMFKHFLGDVQWRSVCDAVGLNFTALPDTKP